MVNIFSHGGGTQSAAITALIVPVEQARSEKRSSGAVKSTSPNGTRVLHVIQRKKSLRDYSRDKRIREGKPLYAVRPLQPLKPKSATGRPSGAQDASQPVKRPRATLKRQSAKARALIPARKVCQAIVRERSGGRCEAQIDGVCAGRGIDVHEIKARSAGGSITNPENCMNLCRPCHNFVTEHPNTARELGFIAPRGA